MKYWRFMDYHTETGHNLILEWFEAQPEDIQSEVGMVLIRLASKTGTGKENSKYFRNSTRDYAR
jgi:hypothetical protein